MVGSNPRDEAERRFLLMFNRHEGVDSNLVNQTLLTHAKAEGYLDPISDTNYRINHTGLERLAELGDK